MIEQAFLDKYPDWEQGKMLIAIDSIDGDYASGLVTDPDGLGGASWLAYRDDGSWQIVWDGNGDIYCQDIEGFDFPVEMVSECYDFENQEMVDLTDGSTISSGGNITEESEIEEAMIGYLTDGELESMTVDQLEGNYAKGSVSLIGGAGGWYLAYKDNGSWSIVAMGSDVIDCDTVEEYGFPTDMVTVCYDLDSDESRILVTEDDLDVILAEVISDLGFEIGDIEDTLFEWEEYSGLSRIEARGTEIDEIVSWENCREKLDENNYYFDEKNTSTNLYGFFVRDNVVCQMYQYNDGGIYLSCGVL
jgi:hypothetical protein